MTQRKWTGVGSRQTPDHILEAMYKFGEAFALLGFILRTGDADGADRAFREGHLFQRSGNIEVYSARDAAGDERALSIAERIHPAFYRCSPYAKLLHARNCYQVLGPNLDDPSDFLICYTPGGEDVGGTRTAIILAREHGIPVYNLALDQDVEDLLRPFRGEISTQEAA